MTFESALPYLRALASHLDPGAILHAFLWGRLRNAGGHLFELVVILACVRVFVLVLRSMMCLAGRRSMPLQLMSITSQTQNQAPKQESLTSTMSKSTMMLQLALMQSMHHCQL